MSTFVLWSVTLSRVENEKTLALDNAIAESGNISAILAANLQEVFGRAELYAKIGTSLLEGDSSAANYLNPIYNGDRAYLRMAVFDAAGRLRHSSANRHAEPELARSVADFLRAPQAEAGSVRPALVISRPYGDSSSAWRVPVLLPLFSGGSQVGMFAAIVDLGYFLRLYREVDLGEGGRIEILRTDGYQLAELNGATLSAGLDLKTAEYARFLASAALSSKVGTSRPGESGGRIGLYRRLPAYPLAVVVSRSPDMVVRKLIPQHRDYVIRASYTTLVFLLLTIGLAVIARRQHRLYKVLEESQQEKHGLIAQLEKEKTRALQLASHDHLTGIPNRMLFYELATAELARARRSRNFYALFFLDLDKFKLINDTLGHAVGDRLLQAVAGRLRGALREYDLLARLGGDEFVMLVSEVATEEHVARIAAKLVDAICAPFLDLDGHDVEVAPSIGIALYPRDGQDVEVLLTHADAAMYAAKLAGCGTYRFYDMALNATSVRQNELLGRFRRAIKESEFCLHYQARVDLQDYHVAGLEALVRWRHPEHGLLYPNDFIGLAEENDLIVPLGNWVIEEACRQLGIWLQHGVPVKPVAVNVSARQLKDVTLLETVTAALERYGIAPGLLEFEVTESCLIEDHAFAETVLRKFQDLGIRIALDDYGIGFSGLSKLKSLPLHALKIDRSFISDIRNDPSDAAIVASTISLAHNLGLMVVAEGVESMDQLVHLKTAGCDQVQGYFFQRPADAAEVEALLHRGRFSPA
ncbi:EAL domain-containing protein [Janthinobacterium sp. 17J80-10]|uniref:putative bifunctional diguanylate cyclase/phosphodiesterase n=1 Tax=Janthinobacterium sp. 17J80-10 TaxID=2497863 RepID=UPI001F50734B|nr:EAL domain-containing protein [Janthinobacterium sp. 17J80-10]